MSKTYLSEIAEIYAVLDKCGDLEIDYTSPDVRILMAQLTKAVKICGPILKED